ncbi:MAG: PadR family transcriptional regulator [Actinobacteria bacterium]|nr:MAG: PadR family transcriptional regulator [Actinomycetota bacterium]
MPVRHAILGLLEQEPRHGYELRVSFEAMVGGSSVWDLKPAQVYTTLTRLEEQGMIECSSIMQAGGPEKRIYSITDEGRRELEDWLSRPVPASHQRDAFFLKLMILFACDGEPKKLLRTQRTSLYRELHELTERRSRMDPNVELAQVLLHDKAVMHLDADLRWLDMIEARLEEMVRQPIPEPEPKRRGRPPKEVTLYPRGGMD